MNKKIHVFCSARITSSVVFCFDHHVATTRSPKVEHRTASLHLVFVSLFLSQIRRLPLSPTISALRRTLHQRPDVAQNPCAHGREIVVAIASRRADYHDLVVGSHDDTVLRKITVMTHNIATSGYRRRASDQNYRQEQVLKHTTNDDCDHYFRVPMFRRIVR